MSLIMYLYIRGAYFAFFWMLFSTIALYFFFDIEERYIKLAPPILAIIAAFITNKPWNTQNSRTSMQNLPGQPGSSTTPRRSRHSATWSKTQRPT